MEATAMQQPPSDKGKRLKIYYMTQVAVKNGNLEFALKKFKQKVARDGVPSECKKREGYDKPGVKRRNAKKEGIKNTRKRNKANKNRD